MKKEEYEEYEVVGILTGYASTRMPRESHFPDLHGNEYRAVLGVRFYVNSTWTF